ncbi:hypothetical protein HY989_03830 [Candidatus Micrarchaeota archaeon]|nr:hypothetical protein [Candidatus Micrarchaeota archaeon]
MSNLFISTGRKPTATARKLARLLSLILMAKYENRGKRSVDDVCARAEHHGMTKIAFIYERKGNPSSIQFFDQTNGWLVEEIAILGMSMPERKGRSRIPESCEVDIKDAIGRKFAELLGLVESGEPTKLRAIFSEKLITFILGEDKILEMKVLLVKKEKSGSE